MAALVVMLFRLVRLVGSGHEAIAVENAALRLQLAAYQRKRVRPNLTAFDRLFWCTLSKVWRRWRTALFVVQPDTVVRWQRERFRKFWARISQRKTVGRGKPPVAAEIRRLILDMATVNPLWRAPRIHGELKNARHRRVGANRLPDPSERSVSTIPDLDDVPKQPRR